MIETPLQTTTIREKTRETITTQDIIMEAATISQETIREVAAISREETIIIIVKVVIEEEVASQDLLMEAVVIKIIGVAAETEITKIVIEMTIVLQEEATKIEDKAEILAEVAEVAMIRELPITEVVVLRIQEMTLEWAALEEMITGKEVSSRGEMISGAVETIEEVTEATLMREVALEEETEEVSKEVVEVTMEKEVVVALEEEEVASEEVGVVATLMMKCRRKVTSISPK
jgi:hypothetical protein